MADLFVIYREKKKFLNSHLSSASYFSAYINDDSMATVHVSDVF